MLITKLSSNPKVGRAVHKHLLFFKLYSFSLFLPGSSIKNNDMWPQKPMWGNVEIKEH